MNPTTSEKVLFALQQSLLFIEEQREGGLDVDYEFDLISEAIAAMYADPESCFPTDFTFCGTSI
jgi:hypothetical protein